MKFCHDKLCNNKGKRLRRSEFPRNTRNKAGINAYCKVCCRRRVKEARDRIRAKKAAQKEVARKPMVIAPRLEPVEKVFNAIRRGYRTREALHEETKLKEEVIADSLALLWDVDRIRIKQGQVFLGRAA